MDTPVTGETLRAVMRHVPAPVTVITAVGADGEAHGITIGSFTSVSLEPPLVSFNVDHGAQIYAALQEAEHFAVHVLSEEQAALSAHFAVPELSSAEQFGAVPHTRDGRGLPLLDGVVAVLHCRPYASLPLEGDTLFVAEVVVADARGGAPLVYHRSTYYGVGRPAAAPAGAGETENRRPGEEIASG